MHRKAKLPAAQQRRCWAKRFAAKAELSIAQRLEAGLGKAKALFCRAIHSSAEQRQGAAEPGSAMKSFAWHSIAKAWRPVDFGPAGMPPYIVK